MEISPDHLTGPVAVVPRPGIVNCRSSLCCRPICAEEGSADTVVASVSLAENADYDKGVTLQRQACADLSQLRRKGQHAK